MDRRVRMVVNAQADAQERNRIPDPPRHGPVEAVKGPLGGAGDPADPHYWPLLCAYTAAWIRQWDAIYAELQKPCRHPDENGVLDFYG